MEEYFVEEKTKYDKLLDFLVFIAVFAVTIFLILEILAGTGKIADLDSVSITYTYFYVNIVVFIIFMLDLFRLWGKTTGFGDFMKKGWLDVLATIPFGLIAGALAGVPASSPAFEIVKWLRVSKVTGVSRLTKVSRVSKVSKEFKAASHLKNEGEEYKKKHRL